MTGATFVRNGSHRGAVRGGRGGAARERQGEPGLGKDGENAILDSRAYARRLGTTPGTFAQAMKLKALLDRGGSAEGSSLDRPGLRRLAARIAPPTGHVPSRHPVPVWSVGDIERFEAGLEEEGFDRGLAALIGDPEAPLSDRERLVLRRRGFAGAPGEAYSAKPAVPRPVIAEEIGVSTERVRRIEKAALARLEEYRAGRPDPSS